jgi:hypothetical protein
MSRLGFQAAAALLLLACGMPLSAQEPAPQPFFAPPRLPEKIQPGAKLLTAPPVTTGCKPDGDISHDGNLVTLHLVAEVAPNYDRYIGEFVMHCHILDHEDSGMMANVLIVPDLTAKGGGLGMPGMKTISNGTMTQKLHQQ